jgi:hypothetical protein
MGRKLLVVLSLVVVATVAQAQAQHTQVHPSELTAVFPDYAALQSHPRWTALYAVLQNSRIDAQKYDRLTDLQTAGLLNLFAKMQSQEVAQGQSAFSFVERITEIQQARVLVIVREELPEQVRNHRSFHLANGLLHHFPSGWTRLESFKTLEGEGNLELTFARNDQGVLFVDADIDDHQEPVMHGLDVLKHTFIGTETHPYDIHQVLQYSQGIDPGYELVAGTAKGPRS